VKRQQGHAAKPAVGGGLGRHERGVEAALDDYFQVVEPDVIRVRGTRIGIETILDDYLAGASPEEIAARYRTLTLEQVYATITYYLHNRAEIDAYLQRWRSYDEMTWQEQPKESKEFEQILRQRMVRARQAVLAEKGPLYIISDQP
jgi:uncharacterized protein (DUF433 family)